MKIAIDVSPISEASNSAHKVRGVGAYIKMLVMHLTGIDKDNEYIFVEDKKFPKDIDLIHYPYFDPFFITLPLHPFSKFVVTVHDLTPIVFPKQFPVGVKGRLKWEIQKQLLKNASIVTTDSDSSGKDVNEIIGIDKSKIKTVYLAASSNFKKITNGNWKEQVRKKYSLPEKFLLYVGDATWNKNLPRLIDAVIRTKYPLVLVGKIWSSKLSDVVDNPWNDDLKNVLRKIEGNTQFIPLGFVDEEDVAKIYNEASALLMPSIYEGFGLPVLEAMICGCPVITSRGGSLPEVGGEACLYVDHQSIESIAKGIEDVMTKSELAERLSEKGIAQSKKFSIEKSIKDIIEVYSKFK